MGPVLAISAFRGIVVLIGGPGEGCGGGIASDLIENRIIDLGKVFGLTLPPVAARPCRRGTPCDGRAPRHQDPAASAAGITLAGPVFITLPVR